MTNGQPLDRRRALRLPSLLAGLSIVLGACSYAPEAVITGGTPDDYRLRHPIAIQEANRSVVIFVGHARGGLTVAQRADVFGLARTWVQEGTGAIVAEVPVDTTNARAAAASRGPLASARRWRALTRDHAAPLSSRRSQDVADDQAELHENCGSRRSLRFMAGGSWSIDQ